MSLFRIQSLEVFVKGLKETIVRSIDELFRVIEKGEDRRTYGSTNVNERSSRSHTLLQLIIESHERGDDSGIITVSRMVSLRIVFGWFDTFFLS